MNMQWIVGFKDAGQGLARLVTICYHDPHIWTASQNGRDCDWLAKTSTVPHLCRSRKVQHHEGRRALCVLVKTQCTRLWTHDHWSSTRVVWARGSETRSCGVFEQIMFWSHWRAETKGLEILTTGSLFAVFAPCTTFKNTTNGALRDFENSRCAWLPSHTTQRRSHSDTNKLRQRHSPLIAHRRRRPSGTLVTREHWLVMAKRGELGWLTKKAIVTLMAPFSFFDASATATRQTQHESTALFRRSFCSFL